MSNPTYIPLSMAEEEEGISSPQDHLLPITNPLLNRHSQILPITYKLTISPSLGLRIISTILALTAFIILVIDGGDAFIAADIFLMLLIIVNLVMILQYCVSHMLKITVEVRNQPWSKDLGTQNKAHISNVIDVCLSLLVLLCIIIGNAVTHHWGGAWRGAVVVGYFVVLCQIAQSLPLMERKHLTLTATLADSDVCLLSP
jgi:hypothetical protein